MSEISKRRQSNQYDKVFRENMELALPGIIEHVLDLYIIDSVELPDDIQHTKERKPDLLKKVTDKTGHVFVLHIEYQTKNDKNMAYRMAEYNIMLQRQYKLPVKQYVLFLGKGKVTMPKGIDTENFRYQYNIIALSSINYKIFLNSDKPEEKILAILANFENDEPIAAITEILHEVKISAKGSFAQSKYFNQLRALVQLRNLEKQFNIAMESITEFFKEEKDPLFRKGEAKGREEGREEEREKFVAYLIERSGLSDEKAADVAEVTVDVVKKIRKKLKK